MAKLQKNKRQQFKSLSTLAPSHAAFLHLWVILGQCSEDGDYVLENASESREVELILSMSSQYYQYPEWSNILGGIGSTLRDEGVFSSV